MDSNWCAQSLLNQMLVSSKNTFTEAPKIVFDQVSGYHGPAEVTHKIHHHNHVTFMKAEKLNADTGPSPSPQGRWVLLSRADLGWVPWGEKTNTFISKPIRMSRDLSWVHTLLTRDLNITALVTTPGILGGNGVSRKYLKLHRQESQTEISNLEHLCRSVECLGIWQLLQQLLDFKEPTRGGVSCQLVH